MKRGRKDKYTTHVKPYLNRIPSWRKDGMTEEQVADKLDVGYSNFMKYKTLYEELKEVLKTGKAELIENLKDSLYKRAMGYEYEEVKHLVEKDEKGKEKKKIERTKRIINSDTCLIFALKNLDPENWRDRKEIKQDLNQTVQHLTIDIVDDDNEETIVDEELGLN